MSTKPHIPPIDRTAPPPAGEQQAREEENLTPDERQARRETEAKNYEKGEDLADRVHSLDR
ncbi:hypothetical protein A6302_03572 [Methylobrevis pamukkalensis]|uniref:Uncharacterized protein n=2 Tax=Methylobrevis pamukkalensis TaxID=1439726 RepID=A0A1E3H0N3_9HYPH|nr:hypothetical protein A6302_03572 [Methylobrevis pamukkalensis]